MNSKSRFAGTVFSHTLLAHLIEYHASRNRARRDTLARSIGRCAASLNGEKQLALSQVIGTIEGLSVADRSSAYSSASFQQVDNVSKEAFILRALREELRPPSRRPLKRGTNNFLNMGHIFELRKRLVELGTLTKKQYDGIATNPHPHGLSPIIKKLLVESKSGQALAGLVRG